MDEAQTFCFEPYLNRKYYYDVYDEGFIFRPYEGEKLDIKWEDIDYLQNSPNRRVEVYFSGGEDPVPIYYDTGEFNILLKTICDKLTTIHGEIFQSQEFAASRSYFIHITFFIFLSLAIIIFGIEYDSKILLVVSALFFILGIHLMNRPISIVLSEKTFLIRNFLSKKIFSYSDIKELDFKLVGHEYSTYLAIIIQLINGKKYKVQRFDNIILCYIFLTSAAKKRQFFQNEKNN
jgi:hypothetical protein